MARHRARTRLVTTTAAPAAIEDRQRERDHGPETSERARLVLVAVDGRGRQRDEAEARRRRSERRPATCRCPAGRNTWHRARRREKMTSQTRAAPASAWRRTRGRGSMVTAPARASIATARSIRNRYAHQGESVGATSGATRSDVPPSQALAKPIVRTRPTTLRTSGGNRARTAFSPTGERAVRRSRPGPTAPGRPRPSAP